MSNELQNQHVIDQYRALRDTYNGILDDLDGIYHRMPDDSHIELATPYLAVNDRAEYWGTKLNAEVDCQAGWHFAAMVSAEPGSAYL